MNNRVLFQAMAVDRKRVALAYHANSVQTAERFLAKTLKRKASLNYVVLSPSFLLVLHFLENISNEKSFAKHADDALMLSTLLTSFAKTAQWLSRISNAVNFCQIFFSQA